MIEKILGLGYIIIGILGITKLLPMVDELTNEEMMAMIFILGGTILMKEN